MLFTSRRTSELIKYAANAFLATKITFINEIADLCEKVGANVQEVAHGIGLDKRIGVEIPPCRSWLWRLMLSEGYAGACPHRAGSGRALRIVETVISVNECAQARHGAQGLAGFRRQGAWQARSPCLGLTFKPNTDDIREAPALSIIAALQDRGAIVRAYDPQGMHEAAKLLDHCHLLRGSPMNAPQVPMRLLIVTEWEQFRALDLPRLKDIDEGAGPHRPAQHLSP